MTTNTAPTPADVAAERFPSRDASPCPQHHPEALQPAKCAACAAIVRSLTWQLPVIEAHHYRQDLRWPDGLAEVGQAQADDAAAAVAALQELADATDDATVAAAAAADNVHASEAFDRGDFSDPGTPNLDALTERATTAMRAARHLVARVNTNPVDNACRQYLHDPAPRELDVRRAKTVKPLRAALEKLLPAAQSADYDTAMESWMRSLATNRNGIPVRGPVPETKGELHGAISLALRIVDEYLAAAETSH